MDFDALFNLSTVDKGVFLENNPMIPPEDIELFRMRFAMSKPDTVTLRFVVLSQSSNFIARANNTLQHPLCVGITQ